MFTKAGNLL